MQLVYYIEVNTVAIWIAAFLIIQIFRYTSKRETSNIVFQTMLACLIIMCASDIVGLSCDGRPFNGAHTIVLVANSIYFAAQCSLAYLWMVFFQIRTRHITNLRSPRIILGALPLLLFISALSTNPFTKIFFYVNDSNTYVRGKYVYIHWIIEFIYVLLILALILKRFICAPNRTIRKEYGTYIGFFIPVIISGIAQLLFYGVSATQIGVVISSLMVFQEMQTNHITRDDLTKLNNRRALGNLEQSLTSRENGTTITLFMIDVDKFKSINDTYGHLVGDEALKTIADVLRNSLGNLPGNRLIIFRYAGDEFVIVGTKVTADMISQVKKKIQKNLDIANSNKNQPYHLGLSIGVATMLCKSHKDFEKLMEQADSAMYEVKQKKKAIEAKAIAGNTNPGS